ncbi:MAG: cytidylate kinase family protein [Candidatus Kerfeldbacteria bacterium]|nr:cytidylate kinase family protein [Candidatus Kerfeldbacteria bacterium]
MIITISGTPGSGKSTIGQMLARRLRYRRVDIGQIRRRLAKKRGLTLEQYTALSETDPRYDRLVDDYQRRLGRRRKNYIMEGRLSFHFIPRSFKIFLYVSPTVGAQRVWRDIKLRRSRNEGRRLTSLSRVAASLRRRMKSDRQRYQQYYGLNPFTRDHYDLYLDTSKLRPRQAFKVVWQAVQAKLR